MYMAHKQEVFEEKLGAYVRGDKKRKGEILNSVVEVTGLRRKACIKRFRRMQMRTLWDTEERGRPRYYTPDCIAALKEVWEIGAEACGENLHSQVNEYIDIQIRERAWKHDDAATFKLRKMSMGSAKKYVGKFVRTRRSFGGKGTTQKSSVRWMGYRRDRRHPSGHRGALRCRECRRFRLHHKRHRRSHAVGFKESAVAEGSRSDKSQS